MIRAVLMVLLLLLLLLSGCASFGLSYRDPYAAAPYGTPYGVPDAEVVVRQPELYTRSEIDAINAETQCRSLARTTLQAQRCGIRR